MTRERDSGDRRGKRRFPRGERFSGAAYVVFGPDGPDSPPRFRRGDSNDDGSVDISDPVHTLNWLFSGGPAAGCLAVANVNGDEAVNIADPTYLLNRLFTSAPAPVAPFPNCGRPPEGEQLDCETPPTSCE